MKKQRSAIVLNGHWTAPWEFDINDFHGFIYCITELHTNKQYIGKKAFWSNTSKKVVGKKNRKHTIKESNWKKYTGSSIKLNEAIKVNGIVNYTFDILSLHETKGSLAYREVECHVQLDVLRAVDALGNRIYYNGNISAVRFLPAQLTTNEKQYK